MQTWVGLLDCNNFFVSCERLFRPDLIGKPTLVLSSNDGCVVARSKEVKDIGIPMGVPYFKIKDILRTNNITVFSGNPALYRDISKRVFNVMREVIPEIEVYSIDEAFFVVMGEKPEKMARLVKERVERRVGIPVSVGIGGSRTLAKLANDEAKRTGGVFVLTPTSWQVRQSETELSQVWGVGAKLAQRFREKGLVKIADLLNLEDRQVEQLFGLVGLRLKAELGGKTGIGTQNSFRSGQQSLTSSRSLGSETTDLAVLRSALAYHINHVAKQLRELGLRAGYLKVFIAPSRFGDFALQNKAAEVQFLHPTHSTVDLLKAANELLLGMYTHAVPYKKVGVLVADLIPETVGQLALFEEETSSRSAALQTDIDAINQALGRDKVQIGILETQGEWQAKSSLRSPAYTTKWTDLAVVRAGEV